MSINVKYYKSLDAFVRDCKDDNNRYLLLVAQECKFYISLLRNSKIKAYGAIFPEIIFDKQSYKDGLLACKLDDEDNVLIQKDISNITFTQKDFEKSKSIIIFTDGLSKHVDEYLDSLFELLPPEIDVLGAGAGVTPYTRKEVIFSSEGIYKDASLVVSKKHKIKVGIEHGWSILKDQLVATMTEDNKIIQIDYSDAIQLYKSVIQEDIKETIQDVNDYIKSYPIGLVKFDNEVLVKEILGISNNSLELSNTISQNSVITILKGEKDKLLKASKEATLKAVQGCKNEQSSIMIFECITRKEFLKDDFEEELEVIKQASNNRPMIGVLSLGEIVNEGDVSLKLFNKTCVVGALC